MPHVDGQVDMDYAEPQLSYQRDEYESSLSKGKFLREFLRDSFLSKEYLNNKKMGAGEANWSGRIEGYDSLTSNDVGGEDIMKS